MKTIQTKKAKNIVLAIRGNIERMNLPQNPYDHSEPGLEQNSTGITYRVRAGDMGSGSASMGGTTARKGYPRGFSSKSDQFNRQRKRDIPKYDSMFVGDHDETMKGTGTGLDPDKQEFTDYRDKIPTDKEVFGDDPRGVHNMNDNLGEKVRNRAHKNLFMKLKNRVKGVYNG